MVQLKQRLTTGQARQGSPRRMNLRVLVGSLVLAIVAGVALYTVLGPAAKIESAPSQQVQPQ